MKKLIHCVQPDHLYKSPIILLFFVIEHVFNIVRIAKLQLHLRKYIHPYKFNTVDLTSVHTVRHIHQEQGW